MRKPQNAIIDGERYIINMLGVDDSLDVFSWLVGKFGGSLGKLLNLNGSEKFSVEKMLDGKMDGLNVTAAIEQISQNITGDDLKKYGRLLCGVVVANKAIVPYDSHFLGRPGHLFKVIFQVLRVNFSDFLPANPDVSIKIAKE